MSVKDDRTFKAPLNWTTTSFMILFHVGAIVALFMFTWKGASHRVCCRWVGAWGSAWAITGC